MQFLKKLLSETNLFLLLAFTVTSSLLLVSHDASAAFAGAIFASKNSQTIIAAVAGIMALVVIGNILGAIFSSGGVDGVLGKSIAAALLVAIAFKPDLLTNLLSSM